MPLSVLRVSGKDAKGLLHRLTTNEVDARREGEAFPNVFTSEKGRVLELATMIVTGEGIIVLGQAPGQALARWIQKRVFREEVRVEDLSERYRVVSVLEGTFEPPEEALATVRGAVAGLSGVHAVAPKTFIPEGTELGPEAFEHERIRRGVPWLGKDVSDENNPHEAALGAAISWDKGCYIGQEVVARLDTYDKVQRHLRRMRLSAEAAPGTRLVQRGEDVGHLTSVSVREGEALALGYVHRRADAQAPISAGGASVTLLDEAPATDAR